MIRDADFTREAIRAMIGEGAITLGGNAVLKIYGSLGCRSGKRMDRANRVFFAGEAEAIALGYRPCGHCLRPKYGRWLALQPPPRPS